jgi:hypothetical protein
MACTKKQQTESRLEELERLSLSQAEIDTIVTEGMQFLGGLEFTLHNGLPEEKLIALRQCIEKIHIDKPANSARISIRLVPVGSFPVAQECKLAI